MNNLNKMYLPLRGPNWPCTLQGPIFVGREHIPSRQGYFAKQFTTSWLQAVVGPPQKKKHLSNYFTSSNPHRDIIMS